MAAPASAWPSFGRDYSNQRFSPLTQINADTVQRLTRAWTSGYNEVLAMLQAQLKLYSERRGFVSDEDQAIQRLQSEIHALASQHAEAQEMRKLIEVAHRTGSPLPPEAVRSINSFAQRGASLGGAVARQSGMDHELVFVDQTEFRQRLGELQAADEQAAAR